MKNQPIAKIGAGISFLILALFLTCVCDAQRRQIYPVPVSATHPDFKLPNVEDGKPISLSDYRGKKVLLVHFASW